MKVPRSRGRPSHDVFKPTRKCDAINRLSAAIATWRASTQENAQGVALGANDTSLSYTPLAGGDDPMEGCARDHIDQ